MLTSILIALVLSVYDGDTFRVQVDIWPGISAKSAVRVRGIDTPEIHGKCREETEKAIAARERTKELVRKGVMLTDIEEDKYGGRVLAEVLLPDGTVLAEVLIKEGLARPYDGGKRQSWCPNE